VQERKKQHQRRASWEKGGLLDLENFQALREKKNSPAASHSLKNLDNLPDTDSFENFPESFDNFPESFDNFPELPRHFDTDNSPGCFDNWPVVEEYSPMEDPSAAGKGGVFGEDPWAGIPSP